MRILRTRATLATVAVLFGAAAVLLGGGVPGAVHYIGHDKVTEVMSKGGSIVSDPGLVVLAQRREAGLVEYHDHTNHVFVMVEGKATLVVGGGWLTPSGPHRIKCVLLPSKAERFTI
jgi:mannose-6-phosphate isomerase-like protein (cupin superfamily)